MKVVWTSDTTALVFLAGGTLIAIIIATTTFSYLKNIFRATIYDALITQMTSEWYKVVLSRLPQSSRVLDVGIGTGSALIKNKDIIDQKNLKIVGVDYDLEYVKKCEQNFIDHKLTNKCKVYHSSIYEFQPQIHSNKKIFEKDIKKTQSLIDDSETETDSGENVSRQFDAVYFSGSLMIMPDPVLALKHVSKFLKPEGKIYITQTVEQTRSLFSEMIKPILKTITTIDFGNVTYESSLLDSIKEAGLFVVENSNLSSDGTITSGDINNNNSSSNKSRNVKIIVCQPLSYLT